MAETRSALASADRYRAPARVAGSRAARPPTIPVLADTERRAVQRAARVAGIMRTCGRALRAARGRRDLDVDAGLR